MKNLPKWAKVLLIIAGVLAFLATAAAVGGYVFWVKYGGEIKAAVKSQADKLVEEGKVSMKEGTDFAATADQNGCLDEALARLDRDSGIMHEVGNRIFLKACVAAAKPVPGFCDGVPAESSIIDGATWALATCEAKGRAGSQPCHRLLRELPKFCRPRE